MKFMSSDVLLIISVYFLVISGSTMIYETLEPTTEEPMTTETPWTTIYNSFTIQWKPYICNESYAPNCHNDSIGNITIHGIWPNYYRKGYPPGPLYCNGPKLQKSDVESMRHALETYWPTLVYSNTNFGFWSYEWDKHGTCWTLMNATEFFATAIDWMIVDGYRDIQNILAANGIVASNENLYLLEDVNKILNEAFDQKITVKCKYAHKYISEFYACRDWFGEKMDCPDTLKSSCPDKVMLNLQAMPNGYTSTTAQHYYTLSPTNNDSYNVADLMVINDVQYDNSYYIQMILLIIFVIIAVWIAVKQWRECKRGGYTEIKNNSERKSMHHSVVMV
eukprot:276568_1